MPEVSGLYERSDDTGVPFSREVIRVDVDRTFPLMAASGMGTRGLQSRVHWVCENLTVTDNENEWTGPIARRYGDRDLMPHNRVTLAVSGSTLTAVFGGGDVAEQTRSFDFRSSSFHDVAFEYDAEEGVDTALSYDTHAHADRPGNLALETLTVDTVFQRAGFRVSRTTEDSQVPNDAVGDDAVWTNAELHDAMQVHFSRVANMSESQREQAAWQLWTFFAKQHERGKRLGGIMFDRIGKAHRQGTAIFVDSFISDPPAGDAESDAWVRRMTFWTAVHEMGHAFNLLHAWQKHLGAPWVTQPSGYDLRSFMNYPFFYQTGEDGDDAANTVKFFREFDFRFSDDELLFMRHAPERFVQMGGENLGSNHALEQARRPDVEEWKLELRVHRKAQEFDFLEPIEVELKLQNISEQTKTVSRDVLGAGLKTVLVQRRGAERRVLQPHAHYCPRPSTVEVEPGAALYESLFVSAGVDAWLIDAPGYYTVYVCLHLKDHDVVSNPLVLRITPPRSWDEEFLAQDFFGDEVARALSFQGTRFLTAANTTFHKISERVKSKAAIHAQAYFDLPYAEPFKELQIAGGTEPQKYRIHNLQPDEVRVRSLAKTLGEGQPDKAAVAAETFGHFAFRRLAERCGRALGKCGLHEQAVRVFAEMHQSLKKRNVLSSVLADVARLLEQASEPITKDSPDSTLSIVVEENWVHVGGVKLKRRPTKQSGKKKSAKKKTSAKKKAKGKTTTGKAVKKQKPKQKTKAKTPKGGKKKSKKTRKKPRDK